MYTVHDCVGTKLFFRSILVFIECSAQPIVYSPFLHLSAVSSLKIINGNQNHPDLKARVVLVTCFSNIDI